MKTDIENSLFLISIQMIVPEKDPMGHAIYDYHFKGTRGWNIKISSSVSDDDIIPTDYLFRDFNSMPKLEQKALELCFGNILDVGAGSGCHSIVLKQNQLDVTPIDTSSMAIEVIKDRGLKNAKHINFESYPKGSFDTLLFLINGIGIVGQLSKLESFFIQCKKLLKKNGQVLLDSSDLIYLFEDDEGGFEAEIDWNSGYYGEVEYQMKYKDIKSEKFNWLFVDFETLALYAHKNGFACELVLEDDHFGYLARLKIK